MLTGGELQLFAVARAVLTEGRILVMDEATGWYVQCRYVNGQCSEAYFYRLDRESEELVQGVVTRRFNMTVIAGAHRLPTIMDYDYIGLMKKGKFVEVGNPRQLAGTKGTYFRDLLTQDASTDYE
jgi:ATP-binding cassette, subfamily C (CFTR/MRP), member 1